MSAIKNLFKSAAATATLAATLAGCASNGSVDPWLLLPDNSRFGYPQNRPVSPRNEPMPIVLGQKLPENVPFTNPQRNSPHHQRETPFINPRHLDSPGERYHPDYYYQHPNANRNIIIVTPNDVYLSDRRIPCVQKNGAPVRSPICDDLIQSWSRAGRLPGIDMPGGGKALCVHKDGTIMNDPICVDIFRERMYLNK